MKWHIKYNGEPGRCSAQTPESCPRGANAPHFSTPEEARAFYEQSQEDDGNLLPLLSKGDPVMGQTISYTKDSPLKKFSKVAGGALVALVAINGISNISINNADAQTPEEPLESSITQVEEVPEETSEVSQASYSEQVAQDDEVKDGVLDGLNQAKNWVVDKTDDLVNWFSGNETVQNGAESINSWTSDFLNDDDYDTILTVEDDGSVKWGDKSLTPTEAEVEEAKANLASLTVAPETELDYDREGMFGTQGDSTRSGIEHRDLKEAEFNEKDRAVSGTLTDVYTGETMRFEKGEKRPYDLEHVVALKEIARSENPNNPLTPQQRFDIANDPENLILVSSSENRSKSDKDAKDYLPSYKPSECRFAIETIKVKDKYNLRVDKGEKEVLEKVLNGRCEAS